MKYLLAACLLLASCGSPEDGRFELESGGYVMVDASVEGQTMTVLWEGFAADGFPLMKANQTFELSADDTWLETDLYGSGQMIGVRLTTDSGWDEYDVGLVVEE